MARAFARKFYKSKEWRGTAKNDYKDGMRQYIFDKYHGLCNKCDKPGEEVHHIIWLTPKNIDNIDITLGEDNLVLLCRDCHIAIHRKVEVTKTGYRFNEEGELIPM